MRIAVCDDDEQEILRLMELLAEYQFSRGESMDCHSFYNTTEFLCDLKGGEYDLVLMDVLMPGISGIQAAQELKSRDGNVRLVFISASPEFAVASYNVEAYHFLLKPVDAAALFSVLDRVGNELSRQADQAFILKSREGIVRLSFAEVEYVEVTNKTVSFHLVDNVVREVTATLADFEERLLCRPEFFKAHRSYLVNLNRIREINVNGIVTKNGHSIPVSRQRRSLLQDTYVHFQQQTQGAAPASSQEPEPSDGPWQILLIDDDAEERGLWADVLQKHGCIVLLAENGGSAMKILAERQCDCILLDVLIPGEDGFAICEKLNRLTHVPIIFLSCLTEYDKQLEGFAAGGIDYITKNTPAELFWAKVETRIRLAKSERTQLRYGPLLIDLTRRRVLVDETELSLTPVEFDILWRLSERAGHVFSPEEIFDMIWSSQPWDGGQLVQMHMSRLRRKLEKAWGKHRFIETVWGQGYRFVPAKP